jgi:hypothetical protein
VLDVEIFNYVRFDQLKAVVALTAVLSITALQLSQPMQAASVIKLLCLV